MAAGLAAALVAAGAGASASERLVRHLDTTSGLPVDNVTCLAQDRAGFLWIGTVAGLSRYDGIEIVRWAAADLPGETRALHVAADGSMLVTDRTGNLRRVLGDRAFPVAGPDGKALGEVRDLVVSPRDGTVWAVAGPLLLRWRTGAGWDEPLRDALGGEKPRTVSLGEDGSLLLATHAGVWRWRSAGAPIRLATLDQVVDLVDLPGTGGIVLAMQWPGRTVTIDAAGTVEDRLRPVARAISLAVRGDTVWASYDRYLVAFRRDRAPEVLAAADGIFGGGPLLVDREGSLWLGTFRGVIQFPEPETVSFADGDGLPSAHTRYVARTAEGVWVSTWQGLGLIEDTAGGFHGLPTEDAEPKIRGDLCLDGDGGWWSEVGSQVVEWRAGVRTVHHDPRILGPIVCHAARDGTVWIYGGAWHGRIFRTTRAPAGATTTGPPPHVTDVDIPPQGEDIGTALYEDRRGGFWLARGESVCRADAASLRSAAGAAVAWTCDRLPDTRHMSGFVETEAGTLWVATNRGGVWRHGPAGWSPVPGSLLLASPVVFGIGPSPSGGMWIASASAILRVEEAADLPEGWRVVESITRWHGVILPHGQDVLEDPDGTLWFTSSAGAHRVPPAARRAPIEPPPVALVDARSDGEPLPLGHRVELPYRKNRLELRFAALSYRAPSLLRYRVRLGPDAAWSDPITHPIFQFVDLAPGHYGAEIVASLDGMRWSAVPASLSFTVLRPWYLEPWALGTLTLLLAALLYLAYRARLSFLLRMERQRARIAMDLHDEMGSGLGSIALLGSLAADDMPDGERRTLAARIAETATDLGTSLGDIVWSLRSRSGSLQALAEHLVERGGALFPGGGAVLVHEIPADWSRGKIELSLPVRRSLQLIALEALHNAARHAGATRVVLGLAPAGGRRWRLWVKDDGRGFDVAAASAQAAARTSGGLGLSSLRARAEEIGADFRLESRPGGGTLVEVTFLPGARDRAEPRRIRRPPGRGAAPGGREVA